MKGPKKSAFPGWAPHPVTVSSWATPRGENSQPCDDRRGDEGEVATGPGTPEPPETGRGRRGPAPGPLEGAGHVTPRVWKSGPQAWEGRDSIRGTLGSSPGNQSLQSNQEKAHSNPGLDVSCRMQRSLPRTARGVNTSERWRKCHSLGILGDGHMPRGMQDRVLGQKVDISASTGDVGTRPETDFKSRGGGAHANFKVWSGPTGSQGPAQGGHAKTQRGPCPLGTGQSGAEDPGTEVGVCDCGGGQPWVGSRPVSGSAQLCGLCPRTPCCVLTALLSSSFPKPKSALCCSWLAVGKAVPVPCPASPVPRRTLGIQ